MTTKCLCQNCSTNLEFDIEEAGRSTTCPECHQETVLFLPPVAPAAPRKSKFVSPTASAPLIEQKLESTGEFFFSAGILGAILGALGVVLDIIDKGSPSVSALLAFVFLIGSVIQGWVMRIILRAAAEAIRLLRKISSQNSP